MREAEKRARKRLVAGASESRLCPRLAVANGVAAADGASPRPPPPPPSAGPASRPPSALRRRRGPEDAFWWEPREMPSGEGLPAKGGHAVGGASEALKSRRGCPGALRHSGGVEGKLRQCRMLAWPPSADS